jgi:hypothetical protein
MSKGVNACHVSLDGTENRNSTRAQRPAKAHLFLLIGRQVHSQKSKSMPEILEIGFRFP